MARKASTKTETTKESSTVSDKEITVFVDGEPTKVEEGRYTVTCTNGHTYQVGDLADIPTLLESLS